MLLSVKKRWLNALAVCMLIFEMSGSQENPLINLPCDLLMIITDYTPHCYRYHLSHMSINLREIVNFIQYRQCVDPSAIFDDSKDWLNYLRYPENPIKPWNELPIFQPWPVSGTLLINNHFTLIRKLGGDTTTQIESNHPFYTIKPRPVPNVCFSGLQYLSPDWFKYYRPGFFGQCYLKHIRFGKNPIIMLDFPMAMVTGRPDTLVYLEYSEFKVIELHPERSQYTLIHSFKQELIKGDIIVGRLKAFTVDDDDEEEEHQQLKKSIRVMMVKQIQSTIPDQQKIYTIDLFCTNDDEQENNAINHVISSRDITISKPIQISKDGSTVVGIKKHGNQCYLICVDSQTTEIQSRWPIIGEPHYRYMHLSDDATIVSFFSKCELYGMAQLVYDLRTGECLGMGRGDQYYRREPTSILSLILPNGINENETTRSVDYFS